MTCPAVRVLHVSKRFRIGQSHDSLRDLVAAWGERLFGRRAATKDSTFWAVKALSFEVEPGEALGIIGPNGAGKSTVLRLLAGILRPEAGEVSVRGRLAALIEVGAGFHGVNPVATGRRSCGAGGRLLSGVDDGVAPVLQKLDYGRTKFLGDSGRHIWRAVCCFPF